MRFSLAVAALATTVAADGWFGKSGAFHLFSITLQMAPVPMA